MPILPQDQTESITCFFSVQTSHFKPSHVFLTRLCHEVTIYCSREAAEVLCVLPSSIASFSHLPLPMRCLWTRSWAGSSLRWVVVFLVGMEAWKGCAGCGARFPVQLGSKQRIKQEAGHLHGDFSLPSKPWLVAGAVALSGWISVSGAEASPPTQTHRV